MIEHDLERIAQSLELISKQLGMLIPTATVTTVTEKVPVAPPPTPEKKAPKAKAEKAPAPVTEKSAEPAKAQEAPKAPEKPVEQPEEESKPEAKSAEPLTSEAIRKMLLEVQAKKGADAAKKIVNTVGNATQITKIDPSKYEMVAAACQEAING